MRLFLTCVIVLYVCVLGACCAASPTSTPVQTPVPTLTATPVPPPEPAASIKSLTSAFNAGNVNAVVALFADDATQTQTIRDYPGYENYIPNAGGVFKGAGVVQDGSIVTSGTCPKMASPSHPDGTTDLTQKSIALFASAR